MHFTYREPASGDDLQQGDVIKRTPELNEIIGKYHPYYNSPDYTHFLVLTQSCDLVKRDGSPKARYVSLAAIRPLPVVLQHEADKYMTHPVLRLASVIEKGKKPLLREFIKKLLNNNHQEFFYLHADAQVGLDRSCAFLRLSVSIKCNEHYDVLIAARSIGLEKEFQAKLGWLVGNLYSRVGTDDWTPLHYSEDQWSGIIEDILDETYKFVDDSKIRQAKKDPASKNLSGQAEAIAFIEGIKIPSKREEAVATIIDVLKSANILDESVADKAQHILKNTPALSAFLVK
ncbi:hypothetical protein [Methylosinus sp. PW1]|uniref:hypothetical protein n=1 Tax=Methylosinus sp. PW1 TaxID=107636 RepID=UPI0012EC6FFE|nr:hypothetical protein [Methylosinus sp. PW1]